MAVRYLILKLWDYILVINKVNVRFRYIPYFLIIILKIV